MKKLLIDMDNTVFNFSYQFIIYMDKCYGIKFPMSIFDRYDFFNHEIFVEEFNRKYDFYNHINLEDEAVRKNFAYSVLQQGGFFSTMPMFNNAKNIITKIMADTDIEVNFVTTAVVSSAYYEKFKLIKGIFPDFDIENIVFVGGNFRHLLVGKNLTSDVYLIDDNPLMVKMVPHSHLITFDMPFNCGVTNRLKVMKTWEDKEDLKILEDFLNIKL